MTVKTVLWQPSHTRVTADENSSSVWGGWTKSFRPPGQRVDEKADQKKRQKSAGWTIGWTKKRTKKTQRSGADELSVPLKGTEFVHPDGQTCLKT